MSETLKALDEQLRMLAKRRRELIDKQADTETKYQDLLSKMGDALLDGGSAKAIEGYKRDLSSLEVERTAIDGALVKAEEKISSVSQQVYQEKRRLAEAEIVAIAGHAETLVRDVIERVYNLVPDIQSLKREYFKAKSLAEPLGITTAELLQPGQFESLEAIKWLMALEIPHRLSVLKRNRPALVREDLEITDVEAPPSMGAPLR